jgi:hypothetical protein
VVDRRRLARLKAAMRRDGIVIERQDGGTEVFPESESLLLEFLVDSWEEGIAEEKSEEFEWRPETARLKEALDGATLESREEFFRKYTPAVAWEEECHRRDTNEGAEEE